MQHHAHTNSFQISSTLRERSFSMRNSLHFPGNVGIKQVNISSCHTFSKRQTKAASSHDGISAARRQLGSTLQSLREDRKAKWEVNESDRLNYRKVRPVRIPKGNPDVWRLGSEADQRLNNPVDTSGAGRRKRNMGNI